MRYGVFLALRNLYRELVFSQNVIRGLIRETLMGRKARCLTLAVVTLPGQRRTLPHRLLQNGPPGPAEFDGVLSSVDKNPHLEF